MIKVVIRSIFVLVIGQTLIEHIKRDERYLLLESFGNSIAETGLSRGCSSGHAND